MFYDDACLKESIFKKLLLVVANLCNLQFFCKYICVHDYDRSLKSILLKIEIHVCFMMNDDACLKELIFFKITIGNCKFMQLAIFCK